MGIYSIFELRIAFDIDGTLTAAPEQLKKVMVACDFSVILTGSLNENPLLELNSRNEGRLRQLKEININDGDYHTLVRCIGRTTEEVAKMKGEYCRSNNIDIIFEDTPLYTYWINKISPNTACFLIHEDKYFK